jgi:predicted transcriptional regulator
VDEFLTVNEIAELLKLNPQTVRNWIDQAMLPAIRVLPVPLKLGDGRRTRVAEEVEHLPVPADGYRQVAGDIRVDVDGEEAHISD